MTGASRPLPLLEPQTRDYWTAGAQGRLLIARCAQCSRYQHPPMQRCAYCGGNDLPPSPVSGRGRVATFTINHEAWLPALPVPFVFAAVELAEQRELHVFANVSGPIEGVHIGLPVAVYFEQHGDVYLPMFRPDERH
jgi:uncharacterized OB-fold protein